MKMMEAYLDNAATTKPFDEVRELVSEVMGAEYGNPSSLHRKGVEAESRIREAAEAVAATLKCDRKNIIFTSGGTESNNMAIIGGSMAARRHGRHIVTTCFEHAAVYEPCRYLEEFFGFEVTYVPVDGMGHVDPERLRSSIREDTTLVSVMYVNNEIGSILDIAGLGAVVKECGRDILFHVDAIQAYGKLRINPKRLGIDLLSASSHKIHGPKGVGFLYAADGIRLHPLIHGGGQQQGRRSGTENVPGIAGFGLAAAMVYGDHERVLEQLYARKEYLMRRLMEIDGVTIHACDPAAVRDTAPHIISVGIEGVRSEVLLHALEEKGVYVSSGSACSSNHPGISSSLKAVGVKDSLLESTIRLSLSVHTTEEELDYAVEQMKELLPVLRRYVRR